jgi:hypothetical protein
MKNDKELIKNKEFTLNRLLLELATMQRIAK